MPINLLRFDRVALALPFGPTTLEGVDVGVTTIQQIECHTGTGVFVRSRTVEDDRVPLVMCGGPAIQIGRADPLGAEVVP